MWTHIDESDNGEQSSDEDGENDTNGGCLTVTKNLDMCACMVCQDYLRCVTRAVICEPIRLTATQHRSDPSALFETDEGVVNTRADHTKVQ